MSLSRAPLEKVGRGLSVRSPLRRARSVLLSWLIVLTSWWLALSDARLIHLFDRGCKLRRQKPV
jgi:hypothetical protein